MGKMGGLGRREFFECSSKGGYPWVPGAQALSNPKSWVQMLDSLKSFKELIYLALFLQYSFYKHLLNALCELGSI